jgi:ectoine hydroxylase-related dioxygenase (phytanoyl-CoA dioxygenase family)
MITPELRRAWREDGAILLPGILDADRLAEALAAWEWSVANPGPLASRIAQKNDGLFYNDLANPDCFGPYDAMLRASPLNRVLADLWEAPDVWFMYEQVFLKEGGETRRTPWHQDSSYLTVGGDHLAVAWITFEPMAAEDSLEFVRGSHRLALYDGSRFDVDDDTLPIYGGQAYPRLPDIEADRGAYDIFSFATQPGDIVLFHPKMLHGGAPTRPGGRRRTLTLRYFGTEATYEERPRPTGPRLGAMQGKLKTGDPLRGEYFPKLV